MTKKDYIELARALARAQARTRLWGSEQWKACVEEICHVLAADNERFKRNVFLKACGYEG